MDFQVLRTFQVLARCCSFSQTANEMYITQSTVTKRIAELENMLGRKLFTRNKQGVKLTGYGVIFLSYTDRILELGRECMQEMGNITCYNNYLKMGAPNAIYECYLSCKAEQYIQKNSNAINIKIGHSVDLLNALQDGILDLVFTFMPFYRKGYECNIFKKDTLVLVTGYNKIRFANGILKEELVKTRYLMCNFALNGIGDFIKNLFPEHFQFQFEIDNSTKLIWHLENGAGYSFIPEKMAEKGCKEKKLRIIPLLDIEMPKIVSYYIGRIKSKNIWEDFLQIL